MKAVILAGGLGTRLAPYTATLPKPLIPVGEKPILDIIIRQLRSHGIRDVTMAVGHLAGLLMSYFGDGQQFGVQITYSREQEPLGTAGPLSLVQGLTGPFLVINGDVLTTLDFSDMMARHQAGGALCTLAVSRRRLPIELGVVEYDAGNSLVSYVEKPVHEFNASMGIYAFHPRILDFIPANRRLDLPDLLKCVVEAGERVSCYPFDGYWMDIGRPDDYAGAVADLDRIEAQLFHQS